MRVMLVEPGPEFSVKDVHDGWRAAFERAGHAVVNYNLGDRLSFYTMAHLPDGDGGYYQALDETRANSLAMLGIEAAFLRWMPELVVFTTGYYLHREHIELLKDRGAKVAVLFTESPYEDDRQLQIAPYTDVNVVNDPTNLDSFQMVQPNSIYLPHAYNPDVHHPGPPDPELACDVAFVGTGYPSRVDFLEQVDWTGLDVILAGSWGNLRDDSPLLPYVIHDPEECWPNNMTADLYRSAKVSLNLYRTEANSHTLQSGWSVGPREVELAACGTFFVRDPRPEGDALFPMLPTVTSPQQLGDVLRWWVAHDMERREAASMARHAIADWTFDRRVEQLLAQL